MLSQFIKCWTAQSVFLGQGGCLVLLQSRQNEPTKWQKLKAEDEHYFEALKGARVACAVGGFVAIVSFLAGFYHAR